MKRVLILFTCLLYCFIFSACGTYTSTNEPCSGTENIESIPDETGESLHESSESEEFFLDIAGDLLPLFKNFDDPDECDKANSFLNFIYDEFGEEPLRGICTEMKNSGYSDEMWIKHTGNSIHVLRSLFLNEAESLDNVRIKSIGEIGSDGKTVLTFGGDVCFGDNYVTMPYLQRKGGKLNYCIAQEWIDMMQSADVAMLNNEFSISDRGSPMKNKLYTYVANPEHTKYYNEMGVDYVTLANNHVFDYGEDAFFDTLDTLKAYGIAYSGAGKDASDAEKPFYFIVNGRKIAYISATRAEKHILTPEATEDSAGVFRCYDNTKLLEVIENTKQNCDYVIVLVHWGTEYSEKLEPVQRESAYQYIDAGADLIIGTHAHQLQGIEFYKGKAIFYNLGNFWFNAKTIETGLLKLELGSDGSEEFYFLPGVQQGCKVSFESGTARGREILDRLAAYEQGIIIEDDGHIIQSDG